MLIYCKGLLTMRSASSALSMNELMPHVRERFSNCSTVPAGKVIGDLGLILKDSDRHRHKALSKFPEDSIVW